MDPQHIRYCKKTNKKLDKSYKPGSFGTGAEPESVLGKIKPQPKKRKVSRKRKLSFVHSEEERTNEDCGITFINEATIALCVEKKRK